MKSFKTPTGSRTRRSRIELIAFIKAVITIIEERSALISLQTLKSALGSEAWKRFKILANLSTGGPTRESDIGSLAPYVTALQEADRRYRIESKNPPSMFGRKRLKRGPNWTTWEGAYEHAYELLEEILADAPGLRLFFDRDVQFGQQDGNFNACPSSAPRILGSRSPYAMGRIELDMDCALPALEDRLVQLEQLESAKNVKRPVRSRKSNVPATPPTIAVSSRWWLNPASSYTSEQIEAHWKRKP